MLEFSSLNTCSVEECAMAAVPINNGPNTTLVDDHCVLTRDAWITDNNLPNTANRCGSALKDNGVLSVPIGIAKRWDVRCYFHPVLRGGNSSGNPTFQ
jgi:hypothetical protein